MRVSLICLVCAAAALAAPKRLPLRQFARVVFYRDSQKDPGRWIGQTAVGEYRHPKTKVTIFLLAMHHVGNRAYFDGLTRHTLDADIVLTEGAAGELATEKPKPENYPEAGRWLGRNLSAGAAIMDHSQQWHWESDIADKRWHHIDMKPGALFEGIEQAGSDLIPKGLKSQTLRWESIAKSGTKEQRAEARAEVAKTIIAALSNDAWRSRQPETVGDRWHRKREAVMFKHIKTAVESKKHRRITVIVGAQHARYLAPKLIAELGLRHRSTAWHDFLDHEVPPGKPGKR